MTGGQAERQGVGSGVGGANIGSAANLALDCKAVEALLSARHSTCLGGTGVAAAQAVLEAGAMLRLLGWLASAREQHDALAAAHGVSEPGPSLTAARRCGRAICTANTLVGLGADAQRHK